MILSDTDITFEEDGLEALLSSLEQGKPLSSARLLTVLDGEGETALEDAFAHLAAMDVALDISDLPPYSADTETAKRLRIEQQAAKQGHLQQSFDRTDPLGMYLEELAAMPVCGDLHALAEQLRQANRENAREAPIYSRIMELCLSRVVELACMHTGHGVLLMDLIQEGSMGLWEQLPQYHEGNIEQFRDHWIRWYMEKAVIIQAHNAGVGQKLRQAVEDYRAVDEKLLTELGRNPTLSELAEGLHMSVQETSAVAQMLENARLLQHAKKPEPEELPQEEDQAVEDTAYFQMRQRITELLSGLSEQDAKILSLRYGLEGGLPMSAQQVGSRLGLTPEEVDQREAAALVKLRQHN